VRERTLLVERLRERRQDPPTPDRSLTAEKARASFAPEREPDVGSPAEAASQGPVELRVEVSEWVRGTAFL
jgi:hypothetical protein